MEQVQRLLVSGRVHQVGYRDWMIRRAQALGVRGWVRNLSDGRVEMVAVGDEAALAAFVEASREGPRLARVDDIDVRPATAERPMKGFTKRFTA
jgi:acylphosphatase